MSFAFTFHETPLVALPSGALHWPARDLLVVSDLHFGKSARAARHGGAALPPYDTRDTLLRLESDLTTTGASHVICLGDSFDAPEIGAALPEDEQLWITRLQAGRDWTWIEGNHDPGPIGIGGTHLAQRALGPLVFRHIATSTERGEVSGHYHPKARISLRGRTLSRPCFLVDDKRLILPAYGAYTGGLDTGAHALSALMQPNARAILTGPTPCAIPMPR
ncbi:ligase-associated DNA damage response endonuclease PdeM [Puniceibacterium sediminis]|uniref:Putative phosphoesterase n=1 Tax=Puniceibacterium sediminis TaxID=1608407 RepID=A0A238UTL3_9RHOB|nr:ligase-associated DNA damage response endonuclease PdeM [Puniceibacterium sediminis]SNR25376.1 putative phosphoesterase [Puniceibacterium sediminis]